MQQHGCPVCRSRNATVVLVDDTSSFNVSSKGMDVYTVECNDRCGVFDIEGSAAGEMANTDDSAKREHALQTARAYCKRNPGEHPRPFIRASINTL